MDISDLIRKKGGHIIEIHFDIEGIFLHIGEGFLILVIGEVVVEEDFLHQCVGHGQFGLELGLVGLVFE